MCKRSRPCILVDSDAEDGGERERELRKFDAAACPCERCSSSPLSTGALTPVPGEERDRGGHNPTCLLSNWCWYCHRFIFKSEFNHWCSFDCFSKATRVVDKGKLWDRGMEIGIELKNTIGFWFCDPCTKKSESEKTLIPIKSSYGLKCWRCKYGHGKIGKGCEENAGGGGVNMQRANMQRAKIGENRKAKEVVIRHPMLVKMILMMLENNSEVNTEQAKPGEESEKEI
ncbi:hypothetical protein HOP50_05g35820 [Chloropicon primus]|nr:hypothetical protein HOP50_05g35820 [Chloropicon primus]